LAGSILDDLVEVMLQKLPLGGLNAKEINDDSE